MKKIIDWFGGSVVKDIMGGLDKLFTSKEEKILAENAIKQILVQKQLELQKMQTEIIVTEAKGNWLQRSWRPILMLAFGFIAPFLFSIGGMVIAYLIAKNWSTKNRSIALIVATFIGLFVAIGSIFLIQRRINVKLKKNNS